MRLIAWLDGATSRQINMLVAPLFTTITGFIKASYCSLVDCSCKWSLQQINLAKLVESSGAYLVHLAPHRLRLQILTMTAVNSSTAQWSVCCLHTSSGHDKNLDAESLNCQPPLLFFFFLSFHVAGPGKFTGHSQTNVLQPSCAWTFAFHVRHIATHKEMILQGGDI